MTRVIGDLVSSLLVRVPVTNQTRYPLVIATLEGVTLWNIRLPLIYGADF